MKRAVPWVFMGLIFALSVNVVVGCCPTVNYPFEQEALQAAPTR